MFPEGGSMFAEDFDVFERQILLDVGKSIRGSLIKGAVENGLGHFGKRFESGDKPIEALDALKNLLVSSVNGVAKWTGKEYKSVVSEEIDDGFDVTAVAFKPINILIELKCQDFVAADLFIRSANQLFHADHLLVESEDGWQKYKIRGIVNTSLDSHASSPEITATVIIDGFISTVNRQFRRNASF
jgi:hypothetical protein